MTGGLIFFFIHPDDEIGAAGLICKLVDQGVPVHLVVGTHGEGGAADDSGRTIAETREAEVRASAAALGVETIDVWDYVDPPWDGVGQAPEHDPATVRRQVRELCEKYQVDVVLGHGSSGEYNHRGHIAWHDRVKEAITEMQPDGPVMYSMAAYAPEKIPVRRGTGNLNDPADFVIDVSAYQERMKKSLRCHVSQDYFSGSDFWKKQYEAYHRQVPKADGTLDDKMQEWIGE